MLIFNHPSWIKVLENSYGLYFEGFFPNDQNSSKIYFNVKKVRNITKYINLPFTDEVDIASDLESLKNIIEQLGINNTNIFFEIRNKFDFEGFILKQVGYKHILDLTPEEKILFSNLKKTQVQQRITKAKKYGLTVSVSNKKELLEEFYKLHLVTRKKLGVPVQPKKFFENLWGYLLNKGLGFIVNVYHKNIPISSGIFLGVDSVIFYKFGASHPNFLRLRPNNLMLWSAILEAKKRGFRQMNFGRTDLDAEGLRKFKLGWGTEEEPLYYSYYPYVPDRSNFQFIKNKIVKPIIKFSPSFICRLTGELFYKYFG